MSGQRPSWLRLRASRVAPFIGLGAAVAAQAQRLPLVAVAAVAVGLAPLVGRGGGRMLSFRVREPGRTWYVGDRPEIETAVTNTGTRTTSVATVTQASPGLLLPEFTVPDLRPGETVAVRQRLELTGRRGPAPVVFGATFHARLIGLEGRTAAFGDSAGTLPAVRPRPVPPPPALLQRLARPAEDGRGSGRRGSGDPMSLRQFASGDPVSSVHWRSTARAGSPVVMEYERLVAGALVLLVAFSGTGTEWEQAVARAAGLVQAANGISVPVEVLAAAPAVAPPGSPGHDDIQDWLAGLTVAGPADRALATAAVRRADGGLMAVLSAEPGLAPSVVAAGAAATSVVDLYREVW